MSAQVKRWGLFAVVLATIAIVLIPLGRWERARWVDSQADGMRPLFALAGANVQNNLSGSRLGTSFDCLLYAAARGKRGIAVKSFAVELCFDAQGRLVEAIDRRGSATHFWFFRPEPSEAPFRVAVPTLIRAFHAAGVLLDVSSATRLLPVGYSDSGPHDVPRHRLR